MSNFRNSLGFVFEIIPKILWKILVILRDFVGTPAANFADPGIWHTVEIKQVPQGRIIKC